MFVSVAQLEKNFDEGVLYTLCIISGGLQPLPPPLVAPLVCIWLDVNIVITYSLYDVFATFFIN